MNFFIKNLPQAYSPVRMEFFWEFPQVATTPYSNVRREYQVCPTLNDAATLNPDHYVRCIQLINSRKENCLCSILSRKIKPQISKVSV